MKHLSVAHIAPPFMAHSLLAIVALFVCVAIAWSTWATLDEVTSANGRIIPSSHVQVIQNLEGGIISQIHVREGDIVEKGAVLLQIDDTRFASSYREGRSNYLARQAQVARLTAEVEGRDIQLSEELLSERPDIAQSELALFRARRAEFSSNIAILEQQVTQQEQEIERLVAEERKARKSLELATDELTITAPMVDEGLMSKVELLRLKREVNDLRGALENTRLAIPKARTALAEARNKIEEYRNSVRTEALNELSTQRDELMRLTANLSTQEDRVVRTTVRSPVKGIVKRLKVATIGGVIQPGMDLVEIVPLEDTLLVEARVRPADIAFLYPGQTAKVKFSAYDYAIYGGLDAVLEHISADTIEDNNGDSYYLIRLRTSRNFLGSEASPLSIIPGMTANVDILTGQKTVMDYLLKPINRAREKALRER